MKRSCRLFLLIVATWTAGCVGPLVAVKDIAELEPAERRATLAFPIYNESQVQGRSYVVLNIVEGSPAPSPQQCQVRNRARVDHSGAPGGDSPVARGVAVASTGPDATQLTRGRLNSGALARPSQEPSRSRRKS
jgi:hypothetical protein